MLVSTRQRTQHADRAPAPPGPQHSAGLPSAGGVKMYFSALIKMVPARPSRAGGHWY